MTSPSLRSRARIAWVILSLCSAVILVRLVDLQVFRAGELQKTADKQSHGVVVVDMPRAILVDRDGVPLAASVLCPSLFTSEPASLEGKENLAERVAGLGGRTSEAILSELEGRRGKGFTWISRKLPFTEMESARAIKSEFPGCGLIEEPGRFYPQGALAANLIGCMGTDGGLSGLEHQWDNVLSGGKRDVLIMKDGAKEATLLIPLDRISDYDPQPTTIRLTLDSAIQYEAERLLEETVMAHSASCGVVIVLDPKNGDLLAMAIRPTFDPNHPLTKENGKRRNRAVTDPFEPGSTFKAITIAGALESGRFKPEDEVVVGNGTLQVGPKLIHDDHPPRKSVYTVEEVLIHSSNVGAARIGMALGPAALYHYIRLFGFGQVTPLAMDAEMPGTIRPPEKWSELSTASLSFGQEISATPLQLALAYASIASGGYRVVPRILPDATVPPPERILSPSTAEALNRMLVKVVTEGTGKSAAIPGVAVAGKTGTAQKLGHRGADGQPLFTAFFVGYAPAEDPRLICLVMVDEPCGAIYGGAVSAPVFSKLVGFALKRSRTGDRTGAMALAARRGAA